MGDLSRDLEIWGFGNLEICNRQIFKFPNS